jgi:hypothetical protein
LIDALKLRRSIREYADRPLPPQVLSDLLWAAFGVNRPSGDRTAPYWRHVMVIDVYAALADGVWLYDPEQHRLEQRFVADKPRRTHARLGGLTRAAARGQAGSSPRLESFDQPLCGTVGSSFYAAIFSF